MKIIVLVPGQNEPNWFWTRRDAEEWAHQNGFNLEYHQKVPVPDPNVLDAVPKVKMENRKEIENLIREFVLLELEDNPQRKTNDLAQLEDDSVDLQLDSSISSFDKSAKDQDGTLQMSKFASDIATLADHLEDQIDLKGALVRRVANYLTKAYDDKVSQEVLRMLEDSFGLSTDPSFRPGEIDANQVPVSKDGGPDATPGGAPPP